MFRYLLVLIVLFSISGCARHLRHRRHFRYIGKFRLHVYWLAHERWYRGRRNVPLYKRKRRIAWVSRRFAKAIQMQGSGRLRDGRIVQYRGRCRYRRRFCLRIRLINRHHYPMGVGAAGIALKSFRSLATDRRYFAFRTRVYIPSLGRLLRKRGKRHNGCFVVHDRGGGIRGAKLDLFVGSRRNFRRYLKRRIPRYVRVYRGCSIKH